MSRAPMSADGLATHAMREALACRIPSPALNALALRARCLNVSRDAQRLSAGEVCQSVWLLRIPVAPDTA